MANRDGYYDEYYDDNAEEIAKKRKERYESDPVYRQKVLDRSRKHREEQRAVRPQARIPRYAKSKKRKIGDGTEIDLFTVGLFAFGIGRSVQCVNHWEGQGILPTTPYRQATKGGNGKERHFRYFTRCMAEAVREVVGDKWRLDPPIIPERLSAAITGLWRALGVPVDCTDGLEAALRLTKSDKKDEIAYNMALVDFDIDGDGKNID